jgi:hypothetical protein
LPRIQSQVLGGDGEGFSLSQWERAGVRESGSFHQQLLKKWDAPLAAKAETIMLDGNTPMSFQ